MELLLDTANVNEIEEGLSYLPVSGVTTNPTIIKREGRVDFFAHLNKIKTLCGAGVTLHVQVSSAETQEMLADAERIFKELGSDTYIKIPVTQAGLAAIKILAAQKKNVTATAVYSTAQGMLALLSGAKYIAVYYNRMKNIDVDSDKVIRELAKMISDSGRDCKILGASFKNVGQVTAAFVNGAQSCTVSYDILKTCANLVSVRDAVATFNANWHAVYGEKRIATL